MTLTHKIFGSDFHIEYDYRKGLYWMSVVDVHKNLLFQVKSKNEEYLSKVLDLINKDYESSINI